MESLLMRIISSLVWLKTAVLACDFVNGEWVFASKGNNYICSTMCRCQEIGEICMRGCEECCTAIKNVGEKFANKKLEAASTLKGSSRAFVPVWILIGITIGVLFTVFFQQRYRILTLFRNCLKKVTGKSEPPAPLVENDQNDSIEVVVAKDDNDDIVGGRRLKTTMCAEESKENNGSIYCRILRQVSGGS